MDYTNLEKKYAIFHRKPLGNGMDAAFNESDHPRDDDGKFASSEAEESHKKLKSLGFNRTDTFKSARNKKTTIHHYEDNHKNSAQLHEYSTGGHNVFSKSHNFQNKFSK